MTDSYIGWIFKAELIIENWRKHCNTIVYYVTFSPHSWVVKLTVSILTADKCQTCNTSRVCTQLLVSKRHLVLACFFFIKIPTEKSIKSLKRNPCKFTQNYKLEVIFKMLI